uniref:Nucleoplasmin-2 n=1 Tax=Bos indicus x Bos taurus TaxID=30522 RepID=A0A4W2DE42_BOBOX
VRPQGVLGAAGVLVAGECLGGKREGWREREDASLEPALRHLSPSPFAGCELNQERPTWTFKPQKVGKQDCVLLLSTISLGEKAKEEVNVVEILPSASPDDKKRRPLTLASLRASVLPMVVLGLEFSPPVTFQLRAGSGPVFLCGQEHYNRFWEEVEEEDDDLEEEEDDDDDDEDIDMFLEETPVKQVKRLAPQKQTSAAKEKKVEKKEEAVRHHLKGSPAGKPKKPGR